MEHKSKMMVLMQWIFIRHQVILSHLYGFNMLERVKMTF
ncbi:hypothetical protein MCP1_3890001 [Candidatus Terasakiella magnetica]|nr:hypothetical protein MCP1_3890001 [Candidatus Terasakiella magnetica]